MRAPIRTIGSWAPLPAALSMLVYGIALDLWPLQAGHFFASVFRLDPFSLMPIHGWLASVPGIALWIAACYAAAAAGWAFHYGASAIPIRHSASCRAERAATANGAAH